MARNLQNGLWNWFQNELHKNIFNPLVAVWSGLACWDFGIGVFCAPAVLLKIRPTWVTDLVCMPDVDIICTSSTEREIRFYDTRATKWELRVLVSGEA